ATYTRLQQDEDVLGPLSAGGHPVVLGSQPENVFEAGFDATWEIDLFGGTRRSVEAAHADLDASLYDRGDVALTLVAEVARDYIELRGLQRQLEVAHGNLKSAQDTFALTSARNQGGLAPELDVERAQAQAHAAAARIPALEVSYKAAVHRLGVLLGESPE